MVRQLSTDDPHIPSGVLTQQKWNDDKLPTSQCCRCPGWLSETLDYDLRLTCDGRPAYYNKHYQDTLNEPSGLSASLFRLSFSSHSTVLSSLSIGLRALFRIASSC